MNPRLGDRDAMQGAVELAIATPGESVAAALARRRLERRAPRMASELSIASEALGARDLGDQLGRRQLRAPRQLEQLGCVGAHPLADLAPEPALAAGQLPDPPEQLSADPDLDGLLAPRQAQGERAPDAIAAQRPRPGLEALLDVVQVPAKPLDLGGALRDEVLAVVEHELYL